MKVLDSSGWIEFATDGPLASKFQAYLEKPNDLITPSLVVFEVYKKLKRDASEVVADSVLTLMAKTQIIALDDVLAVRAADISMDYQLAMADSIVYATAVAHRAQLITADADFKNLPNVIYFKK